MFSTFHYFMNDDNTINNTTIDAYYTDIFYCYFDIFLQNHAFLQFLNLINAYKP